MSRIITLLHKYIVQDSCLLLIPKSITKRFNWQINQLRLGFEEISRSCKEIAANESLEAMLFSDGLFSFSINVTKAGEHQLSEKTFRKGGLTIYTLYTQRTSRCIHLPSRRHE